MREAADARGFSIAMQMVPTTGRVSLGGVAVIAVVAVGALFACSTDRLSLAAPSAGFWYEPGPFALPADATGRLDGPLADDEIASIERLSRAQVERAFSGLRITVAADPDAFWRVEVRHSLPVRTKRQLPAAGESVALGFLGGRGAVGFDLVALKAIHYAPTGASRLDIIEGIGRGIGRVAVHEFMHQILGVAAAHNNADKNSYEYGSPDRASQYYGELHWTAAWPLLSQRFGK